MCLPFPNRFYQRALDISAQDLDALGVSGVLLDIDGTLTPETSEDIPEQVFQWMDGLKKAGVRLFFLSNSRRPERVRGFAAGRGLIGSTLQENLGESDFFRLLSG